MCKVGLTSISSAISFQLFRAITLLLLIARCLILPYDNCSDFSVLFYIRNGAPKLCYHEIANNIGRYISEVTGLVHSGLTKYVFPFSGGTVYDCLMI